MKNAGIFAAVCFIAAMASFAIAEEVEGPYEEQLSDYPTFYNEFLEGTEEENQELQLKNNELRETSIGLKQEQDYLQTDIQEKKDSITDLKTLNIKLTEDQAALTKQYEELQARFDSQEEENDRLKQELESEKTAFYQKMLQFYQEEEKTLGREGMTIEEWQKEVSAKLEALEEEMGTATEDAADAEITDDKTADDEMLDGKMPENEMTDEE